MKRLGLYTGRVYSMEDGDKPDNRECTVALRDDEAEDAQYVADRYSLVHTWCIQCAKPICFRKEKECTTE